MVNSLNPSRTGTMGPNAQAKEWFERGSGCEGVASGPALLHAPCNGVGSIHTATKVIWLRRLRQTPKPCCMPPAEATEACSTAMAAKASPQATQRSRALWYAFCKGFERIQNYYNSMLAAKASPDTETLPHAACRGFGGMQHCCDDLWLRRRRQRPSEGSEPVLYASCEGFGSLEHCYKDMPPAKASEASKLLQRPLSCKGFDKGRHGARMHAACTGVGSNFCSSVFACVATSPGNKIQPSYSMPGLSKPLM